MCEWCVWLNCILLPKLFVTLHLKSIHTSAYYSILLFWQFPDASAVGKTIHRHWDADRSVSRIRIIIRISPCKASLFLPRPESCRLRKFPRNRSEFISVCLLTQRQTDGHTNRLDRVSSLMACCLRENRTHPFSSSSLYQFSSVQTIAIRSKLR